jgi:predicted O-methyltransferase YrrM
MSESVKTFIRSYQGLIILAISAMVGFSAGWFGNQFAIKDLGVRVTKLEVRSENLGDQLSTVNNQLSSMNTKLDLILAGKIK